MFSCRIAERDEQASTRWACLLSLRQILNTEWIGWFNRFGAFLPTCYFSVAYFEMKELTFLRLNVMPWLEAVSQLRPVLSA